MLGLEPIDEIIKLALYSAYIKDEEQPISLLICAEPEAGKTEETKKGTALDGVLFLSDASAYGVLREYGDALAEKKIRHIIIPDLRSPLSKRWETSHSFVAFLNSMTSEGIVEVRTYAMSKRYEVPVKCGVITCITPRELNDSRHKWLDIGFMSRLLPVSWSYSQASKVEIFKFIQSKGYTGDQAWEWEMPKEDVGVEMDPDLAGQLLPYTYEYAQARDTYGFRYQKHLQRMLMASAIADGRAAVNQGDVDKVTGLTTYLNLGKSQI